MTVVVSYWAPLSVGPTEASFARGDGSGASDWHGREERIEEGRPRSKGWGWGAGGFLPSDLLGLVFPLPPPT